MKATRGAMKSLFAIVMLIALGMGTLPTLAAETGTAGRKHAAKANQLAAKNKCKSAVAEFTKAYKSLKDPTLLFNRAECYRKMGSAAEALKDYEQFLADMPAAPNHASVEARIASLRVAAAAETTPPPSAAAAEVSQPALPSQPAPRSQPAPPSQSAPPTEKSSADKVPAAPVHRAERWSD